MGTDAFDDLRPIPADVMLSWPKPNYVNPVRRGPTLLIVHGILYPIVVIVVIARLYTRLRVVRSAGLDDLFIGLALIPTIGLTIVVFLAVTKYSWDIHIWDLPPENILPSRQIGFAAQFLFLWVSNLVKLSILMFYRRMSAAVSSKPFSRAIWITVVFVICFHISAVLGLVTSCNPIESNWDVTIPNHHCFNQRAFKMVVTIVNSLTDFVIILIPLPTVWGLRLQKKQKIALSCIFLTGFFACIAGLIRTYYAHIVVNVTYDVTWVGFVMWVYTAVEIDIAMICASAPALKPLFRHYINSSSTESKGCRNGQGRDIEDGSGIRIHKEVQLSSTACQDSSGTMDTRDAESEECVIVLQRPSSVIIRGGVF